MVLFLRHSIGQPKADQPIEQAVDQRVGHRQHDPAAGREHVRTRRDQRVWLLDVLEHGQHRDAVEALRLEGDVVRKDAPHPTEIAALPCVDQRVHADGARHAARRALHQHAIATAHVEQPVAGADPG